MNHLRAVNFCFCTESNTFTQPSCPSTLLEGQRTRAEEKRWRDNEPAPVTAIGNQELTLWIIEAWQTRERERERKRDYTIALVSNPISLVHGVCVCVSEVCFFRTAPTASREKQPGIKAETHLCLCLSHNGQPSLTEAFYTCESFSTALCVFLTCHAFLGFYFCACVCYIYRCFPLEMAFLLGSASLSTAQKRTVGLG